MNFITLEPEVFREYAKQSPYRSFTQTPEIAKLREQNGWTAYYFGVEQNGELKAATMLIAKPTFLGKSTFFAPGGPLLDFEDTALVDFFFKHLRQYLKTHNGYNLIIDPNYQLIERDRAGEPVESGFNRKKAIQNLKAFGFTKLKTDSTPHYQFILNLENQTSDQLFTDMKRNTRNHIRKAEKMGVTVRELKREELGIFKQITESTSNRRHFTDKPLSYYEQMYDLFHERGEVMFLLAEADNKPLSAAMFILYGSEVIYLFSGSDEQYMKDYNAQYLIQWHMIKYAVEHKFKTYNFYGIQGLPDKSSKDYGIYDFKKGFTSETTGKVIELIGDYELPVNSIFYRLHQILSKIKKHRS
ncbi:MAG: peptidoglycan bridge formation glycyltransferase FemA/FemB family protein [Candidatus Saccharibacteria bacterium]|nr:peptidoglycan bridge formation glycyltransferase FemA/FemB family protein [Candidatus Saccharibacteria bacterium]